MRRLRIYPIFLCLCIYLCTNTKTPVVSAEQGVSPVTPVKLTTNSVVNIDDAFGSYMTTVDENIYYSLSSVNSQTLLRMYGDEDIPILNMAKECINPCMALATTWGEAGNSYKGISMTTVMDFTPSTYVVDIDWINVTSNLEQVDSFWYIANTKYNYNTNEDGKSYRMPVKLLQIPRGGDRVTSTMEGLGVGPYQVTSSDWDKWTLDERVNPVWGFESSLQKCGTAWIYCGIEPISDLTVYACLSLGHQGGGLINYQFGKDLINLINQPNVQQAFNTHGYSMFKDTLEKSYTKEVSLSDVNVVPYLTRIEDETGIDFSDYTGGVGSTNKGDYVAKHCLRYVFYKYYYTSGL